MKNEGEMRELFEEYSTQRQNLKEFCKYKNISYGIILYNFAKYNLKTDKSKNQYLSKEVGDNLTYDILEERLSFKELLAKYSISRDIFFRHKERNNITTPSIRSSKLTKNFNFFEIIDSETKAYLLGFLYADGNIAKNSNRISLGVQEQDSYILNALLEHVGGKITKYTYDKENWKDMYYWTLSNNILKRDLIKLGCFPNKSHDGVNFPEIPDEMVRHFIRGFFDGDGSVGIPYKNSTAIVIRLFNTDKTFLERIEEFIGKGTWNITIKPMSTIPLYTLRYGVTYTSKIKELFYNDSTIYLTRKKQKFDDWSIPREI